MTIWYVILTLAVMLLYLAIGIFCGEIIEDDASDPYWTFFWPLFLFLYIVMRIIFDPVSKFAEHIKEKFKKEK